MNDKLESGQMVMLFNGEEIMTSKAIEATIDSDIEKPLFERNYKGTISDIDLSPEFANILHSYDNDKRFKVIGNGFKLPRGTRLPKKKRIRKKWKKNYEYSFELNDCVFNSGSIIGKSLKQITNRLGE